ncbi:MAG: hypothetical protein IJ859_01930 [Synergistaceae bacterium]|nr:hypothetical protein [Synergistaceae bacterium]
MAEVMTKKGHEVFINLEALEDIKNNLFELPKKQRSLLTIEDAVTYLLPSILNAKDKNYSEAEILELFAQVGLNFNKSAAMNFWRTFKSMTQGKKHKKHINKKIYIEDSDGNMESDLSDFEATDTSINTDVLTNAIKNVDSTEPEVSVSKIYEELRKSLPDVDENIKNNEANETAHSSAYFEVKPDTEDL